MSAIRPSLLGVPRRPSRNGGFTLIELMVAMLLGLIVIAGVTSVFLAGQQSYRTNNALADVQDGSRIAFELMARDIREAGLTGCNSTNDRIVNVLQPQSGTTPYWWANWDNPVQGYNDATIDPALGGITGSGAPVAGTNSLELLSAGDVSLSIANDVPGTNFKLNAPTTALAKGDVIMACSPDHAAILQITNYNSSNVTVGYNTGNSVKPGNCSSNLGYPNDNCTGNSPDYTFPPNSTVSTLSAVDWYIGANLAGGSGKSLYRVSLQNNAGTPTASPQEMVRNVTGMTITYLNPSIGTTFVPASTLSATDWAGVTAVQVQLTLESTFQRASVEGNQPISRVYSFVTTLRNRVD